MSAKEQIKIAIIKQNRTLSDVVKALNEKYSRNDTIQNLSGKLSRDTLKYREAEEIAEILGITITWKEDNN